MRVPQPLESDIQIRVLGEGDVAVTPLVERDGEASTHETRASRLPTRRPSVAPTLRVATGIGRDSGVVVKRDSEGSYSQIYAERPRKRRA